MSDNVKDELEDIVRRGTDRWTDAYRVKEEIIAHLAERGMVVLGPDGEPLDVTPLLRALGHQAKRWDRDPRRWLARNKIIGTLAHACLAAAEVQP